MSWAAIGSLILLAVVAIPMGFLPFFALLFVGGANVLDRAEAR